MPNAKWHERAHGGRSPIHGLYHFLRHAGIVPGKSHEAMASLLREMSCQADLGSVYTRRQQNRRRYVLEYMGVNETSLYT